MVTPGPVPSADLLEVVPGLDEWNLDKVVESVERFVLRVSTASGLAYSLCHQRFQHYLTRRKLSGQAEGYRRRLLAYCEERKDGPTPYVAANYAALLADASEWTELHALVATGADSQDWADRRNELEGSYAGYLADISLMWQHVDSQEMGCDSLSKQLRYALIKSTVHSLATSLPGPLVAEMVRHGLWTPARALEHWRHTVDRAQRGILIDWLVRCIRDRDDLVQEALQWAGDRGEDSLQDRLRPLLGRIAERDGAGTPSGGNSVCIEPSGASRMASNRPTGSDVGRATSADADEWELYLPFSRDMPLSDVLSLMREPDDVFDKQNLWLELMEWHHQLPSHWKQPLAEAALETARAYASEDDRTRLMTAVIPVLPAFERSEVLLEALSLQRDAGDSEPDVGLLVRHPRLIEVAVSTLPGLPDWALGRVVRSVLAALRGLTPDWLVADSLGLVHEFEVREWRASILGQLAPFLPSSLMECALDTVWSFGRGHEQAQALAALIPVLPRPLLRWALQSVIERQLVVGPPDPSSLISGFGPDDEHAVYDSYPMWEPHEQEEDLWRALSPKLSRELLERIYAALRDIGDEAAGDEAIEQFTRIAAGECFAAVFPEEPTWADEPDLEFLPRSLRCCLEERVGQDSLRTAIKEAHGLGIEDERDDALIALATRAAELGFLDLAMETASAANIYGVPSRVLSALPLCLDEEMGRKALEMVRRLGAGEHTGPVLVSLLPKLPSSLWAEALQEARGLEGLSRKEERVLALAGMSRSLPTPERLEVVGEAFHLALESIEEDRSLYLDDDTPGWLSMLDSVACDACSSLTSEELCPLWRALLHSLASLRRQDLLSATKILSRFILAFGCQEALEEVVQTVRDVGRWWP